MVKIPFSDKSIDAMEFYRGVKDESLPRGWTPVIYSGDKLATRKWLEENTSDLYCMIEIGLPDGDIFGNTLVETPESPSKVRVVGFRDGNDAVMFKVLGGDRLSSNDEGFY